MARRLTLAHRREIAVLLRMQLDAGIGPFAAFSELARRVPGRAARAICARVAGALREGAGLVAAATAAPELFQSVDIATLELGQRTGELAGAVRQIEEELAWRLRLRRRVALSLVFPLLVLEGFFATAAIPWLLAGDWVRLVVDGVRFHAALLLVALLFANCRRFPTVRAVVDTIALELPGLRRILGGAVLAHQKGIYFSSLARVLATGGDLGRGLELATGQLSSPPVREDLLAPAAAHARGAPLAEGFRRCRYLEPLEVATLTTAEGTGGLPDELRHLARLCRADLEAWWSVAGRVFPLLVVAGTVMLIALRLPQIYSG